MPQAPAMMAGGKGVVVNISSMQAFFGLENQVAYGASKAALNQATRVMAVELGPSTVALPHREALLSSCQCHHHAICRRP